MFVFTHIGIVVSNTDVSVQFYRDVLGCTVEGCYTEAHLRLTYLKAGALRIELIEHLPPAARTLPGPVDHLAFAVQDIDAAVARLKAAGVVLSFPSPRLVNQQKIIFFTGPDGERLELIQSIQ